MAQINLTKNDALLIVDVQNDFLPNGNLAVSNGDKIITPLNRYIRIFRKLGLPIFASRDWHPANHCSFKDQGGIWPPHCIADTQGAQFAATLELPKNAVIVSKASLVNKDAYSAFDGTNLKGVLHSKNIRRLFVGGLATDYCVLNSVKDALKNNFAVFVLQDAIRAVNLQPDDDRKAEEEMQNLGASFIQAESISA